MTQLEKKVKQKEEEIKKLIKLIGGQDKLETVGWNNNWNKQPFDNWRNWSKSDPPQWLKK